MSARNLESAARELLRLDAEATPGPWDAVDALLLRSAGDTAFIVAARNTAPAIARAYLAAVEVLRRVEWADGGECPVCLRYLWPEVVHAEDCALAAALGARTGPEPVRQPPPPPAPERPPSDDFESLPSRYPALRWTRKDAGQWVAAGDGVLLRVSWFGGGFLRGPHYSAACFGTSMTGPDCVDRALEYIREECAGEESP